MKTRFKVLLPILLLLAPLTAVHAQFTYATNNGTITITYPSCPAGALTVPSVINGLPVTAIGTNAFEYCRSLTSVVISNSVTTIGPVAFWNCTSLASVTIGSHVANIGDYAFGECPSLTTVTIPNSITNIGADAFEYCTNLIRVTLGTNVISIGDYAFWFCTNLSGVYFEGNAPSPGLSLFSGANKATVYYLPGTTGWSATFGGLPTALWPLTNWTYTVNSGTIALTGYSGPGGAVTIPGAIYGVPVTSISTNAFFNSASLTSVSIPNSVTNIGNYAFSGCTKLAGIFFQGNVPSLGSSVFAYDENATAYYLPGTTGWGATFGGRPAVLWNPQMQTSGATFGVRTNRFGFTIIGTSNLVIVVDASTNLANHKWAPVGTNTLANGSSYFSDPQWTNHPARLYRLRSP
jgi:hypothetical protein